jgi:hypothetical protein
MTGAMDLPSTLGGVLQGFNDATMIQGTPVSQQLCAVTSGTSGLNGYVTVVQQ